MMLSNPWRHKCDPLEDEIRWEPHAELPDKGFIRPILKEDLASQGIDLHTPLRSNMKHSRPRSFTRWAAGARRLVETVIDSCASALRSSPTVPATSGILSRGCTARSPPIRCAF